MYFQFLFLYPFSILHWETLDRFCVGTSDEIEKRLEKYNTKTHGAKSYTAMGVSVEIFNLIEDLRIKKAYEVERHHPK